MRRAAKIDANQNPIVRGLISIFGPDCVFDASRVGQGFPDIVVGIRGVTLLMEIKTDGGTLTPSQIRFHRRWQGHRSVVRTLEEALQVIEKATCK